MRFSAAVVSAFVASATGVAAFTQRSTAFVSSRTSHSSVTPSPSASHPAGCFCSACVSLHSALCACASCSSALRRHSSQCRCSSCASTRLFAETVEEASTTESIPEEVAALDGVLSTEEAHNVERPARKSLKKKSPEPKTPLAELKVGDTVSGRVKSITTYGAFLDIGAETDGLLHISKLAVGFVSDVNDVVKEGQQLDVRIIKIDPSKKQVALTLLSAEEEAQAADNASAARPQRTERAPRANQQQSARKEDDKSLEALKEKGWNEEQFVTGTVVSTVDFGAFIRINAADLNAECSGSFDGLLHISSMAVGRVDSVASVCSVDDKVQVRVRSIDNRNKVSLSMVSVEDEEAAGSGADTSSDAEAASAYKGEWKDAISSLQEGMPQFQNKPMVVDKRK